MNDSIRFNIGADNTAFISTLKKTQAAGARAATRIQGSFDNLQLGKTVTSLKGIFSNLNFGPAVAGFVTLGSAAAALYTVADGLKGVTDFAGKMSDLSARTGVGVKQTILLTQAFKNAGMESGAVGSSINKLQKALAGANEDGAPTAEIFNKLGLNVGALQAMDPAAQFEAVGAAIAALSSDADKAAAAMAIFGKSGGELLAIFKDSEAFKVARDQVGKLGDEIEKNATAFDKFSDAVGALELKPMQLFAGVASGIAGDLETAAAWLNKIDLVDAGQRIVRPIRGAIDTGDSASRGFFDPIKNVASSAAPSLAGGIFGLPFALARSAIKLNSIGGESQAISKQSAAAFESEARLRAYDIPRPLTGVSSTLPAAMSGAPDPLRAAPYFDTGAAPSGHATAFIGGSTRAHLAASVPSMTFSQVPNMPIHDIAGPSSTPSQAGRSSYDSLQAGQSSFQKLKLSKYAGALDYHSVGQGGLLGSHQFGLKTSGALGYSAGAVPGSFRIPNKSDQVAAAKAAAAKKESLVGTNESLGEILKLLGETLK